MFVIARPCVGISSSSLVLPCGPGCAPCSHSLLLPCPTTLPQARVRSGVVSLPDGGSKLASALAQRKEQLQRKRDAAEGRLLTYADASTGKTQVAYRGQGGVCWWLSCAGRVGSMRVCRFGHSVGWRKRPVSGQAAPNLLLVGVSCQALHCHCSTVIADLCTALRTQRPLRAGPLHTAPAAAAAAGGSLATRHAGAAPQSRHNAPFRGRQGFVKSLCSCIAACACEWTSQPAWRVTLACTAAAERHTPASAVAQQGELLHRTTLAHHRRPCCFRSR